MARPLRSSGRTVFNIVVIPSSLFVLIFSAYAYQFNVIFRYKETEFNLLNNHAIGDSIQNILNENNCYITSMNTIRSYHDILEEPFMPKWVVCGMRKGEAIEYGISNIGNNNVTMFSRVSGFFYQNNNATAKSANELYKQIEMRFGKPGVEKQCEHLQKPCGYTSWIKGRIRIEMFYETSHDSARYKKGIYLYVYHDTASNLLMEGYGNRRNAWSK